VSDGLALEQPEAARAAALGELEAEPALARSCLGHDADHLAPAGEGALERIREGAEIRIATHEAGEAPRPRNVEARPRRPGSTELEGDHRLGDPLHREGAEIGEIEVAVHEPRRGPGQVAGSGLGERLHALGEADRVPLGGASAARF
jgi:hypothetical protein